MRQFVLPADYSGSETYLLQGERSHYLVNVLRTKVGDRFAGLDANGNPVEIELRKIGDDGCLLAVSPRSDRDRVATGERITLFQCVPKGKKMDLIIRQATEAGVTRIVPVLSLHTVPRYDERDWNNKRERWTRVIREAVQQSGRTTVPALGEPVTIDALPSLWDSSGPGLFFHEKPLAHETLHEYLVEDTLDIALVIGPEGGLAAAETESLLEAGFGAVYLGEHVLRVETATLFAIAAVRIVLLEKDRWKLNVK